MVKVRFTRTNVNRLLYIVASPGHGLGDGATKFLLNGLDMGSDIGQGSRYIGMGGQADYQYGPQGARKAVAYIWGMGCELGVWTRLEHLAEVSEYPYAQLELDRAREMAAKAAADLGAMEFGAWEQLGSHYAAKARDL